MKNINEEILRIKSLFGEERLYGNLVEAECKGCTNNAMRDTLRKKGYKVYERDVSDDTHHSGDCGDKTDSIPWMKCVKKLLGDMESTLGTYNIIENDANGGCIIHISGINLIHDMFADVSAWSSFTIWEKRDPEGHAQTFALKMVFKKPIGELKFNFNDEHNATIQFDRGGMGKNVVSITMRGSLDSSCNIKNLRFGEVNSNGKITEYNKGIHPSEAQWYGSSKKLEDFLELLVTGG